MALYEDSAALIDFMMLKYGPISTDSTGRADCLKWLNRANTELLAMYPWWFLHDKTTLALTDDTSSYTLPADTEDVYELLNANGTPIQKIPHRSAQWLYKQSTAVKAAVKAWWVENRDNVAGATFEQVILRVWPPALGSSSATMFRRIKPGAITDSSTSYSLFPESHRSVIVWRALELMANHQGKSALAQQYKADCDRILQALMSADLEHKKGLT